MSPETQRRTFLSYSRVNKDFALQLAKELKSAGFPVWIDQLDIPTGARWDDELEKALEAAEIFMVILTPSSTASNNVKDEIGYAIDNGKRILPILLKDAKVPFRLRRFQYVDFTNKSYEEGLEGAKQQLRKLIEEPTIPRDQPSAAAQAPKAKSSQPKAATPSPVRAAPASQSAPAMKASTPAQPAKKQGFSLSNLSKQMKIGLGVGALAVLMICGVGGIGLIGGGGDPVDPPIHGDPELVENEIAVDPVIPKTGGESGSEEGPACPFDDSQFVEVNVENYSDLDLDYYWVNYDCELEHYGTLYAGEATTLGTYVTHIWEFYDIQSGDFYFGYETDGGDYLAIPENEQAPEVTGETVSYVAYDGGEFAFIGGDEWVEVLYESGEEFYYAEVGRDEWSVYLYNEPENFYARLDLYTGEIYFDPYDEDEYFFANIIGAE